jgi:hypothetical protein
MAASAFSAAKYRNSRAFQAHPDTHKDPSCERFLPSLGHGPADWSQDTEDSRDEDSTTTAEEMVDGVRKPATNKRRSNIGRCIDNTNKPVIAIIVWSSRVYGASTNPELIWE